MCIIERPIIDYHDCKNKLKWYVSIPICKQNCIPYVAQLTINMEALKPYSSNYNSPTLYATLRMLVITN